MKSILPLALLAGFAIAAAAPAKLTFTKSFPGSVPEYCSVEIDNSGALTYKESPTDDQPIKAQVSESDITPLFDLAQQLEFFKSPIESGLKVANTGKKTFRYESAEGKAAEVVFNYSTIVAAQQLLDRFENIAATERARIDLDRTVHFDHLGINDSLAQVEELWIKKQLIAPSQFVPLLTRITSRESIMHLARERAARLKDEFQAPMAAGAAGQRKE
jgi:hypothetical protein